MSAPERNRSLTQQVVAAAQAFMGTLTEEQKKTAPFAFADSAQRKRWSNFPDGSANHTV
jgi:Protein of unknown function (DUF3500)